MELGGRPRRRAEPVQRVGGRWRGDLVRVRARVRLRLRVSVRVRVRVRVRVWPTVKWNFLSVLQAALKNRIWRTLTTAVEMKCMYLARG